MFEFPSFRLQVNLTWSMLPWVYYMKSGKLGVLFAAYFWMALDLNFILDLLFKGEA